MRRHPTPPDPPIRSPRAPSAESWIELCRSDGDQEVYRLDKPILRIGRLRSNDVILKDEWISKRHAEIRVSGDRCSVRDLASRSGVYVNGEPVTDRFLEDGDLVQFGHFRGPTVRFRSGDTERPDGGAPRGETDGSRSDTDTSMIAALESSTGERDLRTLSQFLEFNRLLGRHLTPDEILPNAVDLAMEMTRAERGFLIQKRLGGGLDFRLARSSGGASIPASEIEVSRSIVKDALDTGEPQVIPDVSATDSLIGRRSVVALDLRSVVALPLTRVVRQANHRPDGSVGGESPGTAGETFGVLYLDSREAREAFDRFDTGLLEALARDVSSVIENARLLAEAEIKRRLEEDITRAMEVQASLLPGPFPTDPRFEAVGSCIPASHLGGDYYDRFELPDGRRFFVMADVVGHGLQAALLAAALQGILVAETAHDLALDTLIARVNRGLCHIVPEGKYATLFACVLSDDGSLTYVNAGHPPPMLRGREGSIRELSTGNLFLGMFEEHPYRAKSEMMRPGDVLTIFTDGVTEATDAAGHSFGEERLERHLASCEGLTARMIHDAVREDVEDFTGHHEAHDDITLLVVRYLGPGRAAGA